MKKIFTIMALVLSFSFVYASEVKIATIDLEYSLKNSKVFMAKYEKLAKEVDLIKKDFIALQGHLKKINDTLNMTPEDADNFSSLQEELEITKLKLKLRNKQAKEQLGTKEKKIISDGLVVVSKLLKDYSEEKNIDLVIRIVSPEKQAASIDAVQTLYSSEKINITKDFTAYVNARYEAEETEVAPDESTTPVDNAPAIDLNPTGE